jgi:pentatricopeptide repeat protein
LAAITSALNQYNSATEAAMLQIAAQSMDSAAAAAEVPERAAKLMGRLRREGIVEDAPLHTSVICWFLGAGLPSEAWEAYHDSRKAGVEPDAVTFTAMMVACAQGDQLEQARSLQVEMPLRHVAPPLATHNAFINVCAARAATLTELPRHKHEQLQRLNVQIDVQSAVGLAHQPGSSREGEYCRLGNNTSVCELYQPARAINISLRVHHVKACSTVEAARVQGRI